jgi:hypothetical protein
MDNPRAGDHERALNATPGRMIMRQVAYGVMVGCGIIVATAVGVAFQAGAAPPAAEPPVYTPATSDLMNAFVQPRHIKLFLAGSRQNWEYAEYERHNIGGAFRRLEKALPTYHGMPTKDLIASFVTPQLADLQTAIKSKNEASFVKAYGALTAGCNACHQATGNGLVVIQQPDSNAYPDQDFSPHAP